MRIGINGYEAVIPRFGFDKTTGLPNRVGSGEFCFQILKALEKIDEKNDFVIYLPKSLAADMPKESDKWGYEVFSGKLWTMLGLSKKLSESISKPDVFFSPTHYLPLFSNIPSVIAILDVSYIHFPKLFNKRDLYQLKLWGRYSISRAKKIITISNSSKNDIIKMYGVSEDKIKVVYPGIKTDLRFKNNELSMKDLNKKFEIDRDYILFVGTLQPRKNIERLIEAFSMLKDKELELVIVGKKGWMYEDIINSPKKYGVDGRVKFIHNAGDEDLPSFYKNAICFVLPSLYEGFGLPVLEAMREGCPVLTSNVSSLPEAGGDAAIYFDPENSQDIADKIEKVISSENIRNDMIKKGHEQVKKFSWEKSARDVVKILEEVGSRKHE